MQSDNMAGKPSLTSAHLEVPLIVTNNSLLSIRAKYYDVFRSHACCRKAGNCKSKSTETEKSRSKIRYKTFDMLYKLTLH